MSSVDHRSFGKPSNQPVFAALDIGGSKVVAALARSRPIVDPTSDGIEILGVHAEPCRIVVNNAVQNAEPLERAIRAALDEAEKQARIQVSAVTLGISAPGIRGELRTGEAQFSVQREVDDNDARQAVQNAMVEFAPQGRSLLHALPIYYAIDGTSGIVDPRRLHASRLGAAVYAVTAPSGFLNNVKACVQRAHVEVSTVLAGSYASGLATLLPDEKAIGALVIDIGAQACSMAVFADGALVHVDAIPLGGAKITADLAQIMCTNEPVAEKTKTLHGGVIRVDDADPSVTRRIRTARIGSDGRLESAEFELNLIRDVVRARLEETFELIRKRINASEYGTRNATMRVVLTGGASQTPGIADLAQTVLGRAVRCGRPLGVNGVGATQLGPDYAAAVGLLRFRVSGARAFAAPSKRPFRNLFAWGGSGD